jgi:hypothetical protein
VMHEARDEWTARCDIGMYSIEPEGEVMRQLVVLLWVGLLGWHVYAAQREVTLASLVPKIFRHSGGFRHK